MENNALQQSENNRLDQLNLPINVIVDREADFLLVCDSKNLCAMRWPRHHCSLRLPEIGINNIDCFGLTMNDQGFLYVSDHEKH